MAADATAIEGEPEDPIDVSLGELTSKLDETIEEGQQLNGELRRVRSRRAAGASMWEAIGPGRPPRAVALLDEMLGSLAEVSGVLRRVLVSGLHREGERVGAIAARFGVSHQRISTLLRPREPEVGAADQ